MEATFVIILLAQIVINVRPISIPKREVGFVYSDGKADAPVKIDLYIDINCPYSQTAFPHLLGVTDAYNGTVQLTTHLFILPYHVNSYYATKAAHVVDTLTHGKHTYDWIKKVFDNLSTFYNSETFNKTDIYVVDKLTELALTVKGDMKNFKTLLTGNEEIERATRIGWKYACTRGVASTPTFMVNDIVVQGSPDWTVTDWQKIIDPLLA